VKSPPSPPLVLGTHAVDAEYALAAARMTSRSATVSITSTAFGQMLDREDIALRIRRDRLTCGFCASIQGFDYGFLVRAPCRAHIKKGLQIIYL
jgi:hypothetical protein